MSAWLVLDTSPAPLSPTYWVFSAGCDEFHIILGMYPQMGDFLWLTYSTLVNTPWISLLQWGHHLCTSGRYLVSNHNICISPKMGLWMNQEIPGHFFMRSTADEIINGLEGLHHWPTPSYSSQKAGLEWTGLQWFSQLVEPTFQTWICWKNIWTKFPLRKATTW